VQAPEKTDHQGSARQMADTTHRFWDQPTGLRLLVIIGAEPHAYPLTDGMSLVVGRGKTATLVIDHPSLSREHARIEVRDNSVTLEDLGSRNGTRVRGELLQPGMRVPVVVGDAVVLGAVLVALQGPPPSLSMAPGISHAATAPLPPLVMPMPIAGGGGGGLGPAMTTAPSGFTPHSMPSEGPMGEVLALADLAAPAPVAVLLLGETGVGKTTIAERIHQRSGRTGDFVRVNCAAVPEPLLESELFGYEKGAFSGAQSQKLGLIEVASGGTLLLDEIGDMPLATQAKLLHVVEHGEVMRLGALKPKKVDVRLIAATHRNLAEMVDKQLFRADLFYRINGIAITIPALRMRRNEILMLAQQFLAQICARMAKPTPRLSPDAQNALLAHPWNGNLRELKNVMDRAALLVQGMEVSASALGLLAANQTPSTPPNAAVPGFASSGGGGSSTNKDLRADVETFEREQIIKALEASQGNQTRAAQMLNMPLRTFVKRLTRYGLTKRRSS
jgi:two-component system, NtrC family, response regulator AtoC